MKRLTPDALEALAFAERRLIEFDDEQGIAVLTVGRETFYADIPATKTDWFAAARKGPRGAGL